MKEAIKIEPMSIKDYEEIFSLWNSIPGIGLSSADSRAAIKYYLD
ncbi:MAG TPA: hypothetical protein VIK72_02475 [Clostridiaceae bacterium]